MPLFDHFFEEEKARSLGCSYKQWSYSFLPPGHCPECHLKFKEPVSLYCGHSICQVCCDELLEKCNKDRVGRRQAIRMGTSSLAQQHQQPKKRKSMKLQKSLSIIQESSSSSSSSSELTQKSSEKSTFYLSPQCPACYAPPRFQTPIKNLALEIVMEAWQKSSKNRASVQNRKLSSPAPSSTSSSGFDDADDHHYQKRSTKTASVVDYSIKKCNIAVVGADGIGKSRLVRAQHLNNLFFGKIETDSDSGCDNASHNTELQAKYMIEILDNNDLEGDIEDADGVILAYSCTDHDSLVTAFNIYGMLKHKGLSHIPLILVATKCDTDKSRMKVTPEEGESLARHIGCPHREISARKNVGVNEVFAELVRQIESNSEETLESL